MPLIGKAIYAVALGLVAIAWSLAPAAAQEISEARLALAIKVSRSAPSLGSFDNILPSLAVQTKDRLIQERPDLHRQIGAVVDDIAFKLVARRNDLDTDIARVWARNFTDDELKAINAFFTSDAGKKYKAVAPGVANDIVKASQNWADRLGSEMYDRALSEMKKQVADF